VSRRGGPGVLEAGGEIARGKLTAALGEENEHLPPHLVGERGEDRVDVRERGLLHAARLLAHWLTVSKRANRRNDASCLRYVRDTATAPTTAYDSPEAFAEKAQFERPSVRKFLEHERPAFRPSRMG
jgi:hypothetical protein